MTALYHWLGEEAEALLRPVPGYASLREMMLSRIQAMIDLDCPPRGGIDRKALVWWRNAQEA